MNRKMDVKVSVIIPVYNAEKYLRQCLDSVINQSLREIEIICVDDGSTDGSREILKRYAEKDKRLTVLPQENSGPGVARNKGLDHASGEYVMFLDADDWFELDMLEKLVQSAEKNSSDIVICKTAQFDEQKQQHKSADWMLKPELLPGESFAPKEIAPYLFQFTYGMAWDKLYRSDFVKENCLRFPPLRASEDMPFVFKSLMLAEEISVLPEVKVNYRVNIPGSVSSSFVKYPKAPFDAFEDFYSFFEAYEEKELYRQSFINWAMEYLVWQVCNMPDKGIRRSYYDALHGKWFPELKIKDYRFDYFYNSLAYIKYILIYKMSYLFFQAVLSLFRKHRGRN